MSAGEDDIWRDPFAPKTPWRYGLAVAVHIALIAAVVGLAANPDVRAATQDLVVRLIEATPPVPERAPPKPLPVPPQTARQAPPPPVMAAAAEAPAPASFAVAPQPPRPQQVAAVPVPAAPVPVVTAARFDADYLHNPKPVYPLFSRRQGEEGKVQLRVRVAADGSALEVEIKQGSGFARLDAAARDAVLRWRFVPARRGDEAVESWVGVPIVFSLEH
ncbi:MAG: energy transducer TonB [Rhodocyclaceae bacterium]|nr:energy transducer TonB [Rhodocyclaceae bacterium]